jgi:hypothetical protein
MSACRARVLVLIGIVTLRLASIKMFSLLAAHVNLFASASKSSYLGQVVPNWLVKVEKAFGFE